MADVTMCTEMLGLPESRTIALAYHGILTRLRNRRFVVNLRS
jgi:hypothetical protein